MRKSKTLIFIIIFLMNCSKTYIIPDNIIRDEITSRKLSQEVSISLISILTLPAAGILVQKVDPNLPGVSDLKWLTAMDKNGDTLDSSSTVIIFSLNKNNKLRYVIFFLALHIYFWVIFYISLIVDGTAIPTAWNTFPHTP